ncbi:hypothetical protein [Streptomyces dangxiongensis]|nr:hypothetical protein [Streptomyces dangxiongensis]
MSGPTRTTDWQAATAVFMRKVDGKLELLFLREQRTRPGQR